MIAVTRARALALLLPSLIFESAGNQGTEVPMSTTLFVSPMSRLAIARRIAQWRSHFCGLGGPMLFGDHRSVDLPLTKAEVRAEIARWFWQN